MGTSPPQFCRDGTKCADLPGCDSSMTICPCPPDNTSAALIAKKEEYNCNPSLTSPPQFCRDGTKCADLPACDSSMTICPCPPDSTSAALIAKKEEYNCNPSL